MQIDECYQIASDILEERVKKHGHFRIKNSNFITPQINVQTKIYTNDMFSFVFKNNDIGACIHPVKLFLTSEHKHDFFELIYVHKGSCSNTVNEHQFDMHDNDICFLNPLASHNINAKDGSQIFNILVKTSVVEKLSYRVLSSNDHVSSFFWYNFNLSRAENDHIKMNLNEENDSDFLQMIRKLIIEYYSDDIFSSQYIYMLFNCIILEMIRLQKEKGNKVSNQKAKDVALILEYIKTNCATATVASTAVRFAYHPKYLPNLLKITTGQSFRDLVSHYRMELAQELLIESDLSINDIIEQTGYKSKKGFYSNFYYSHNMTPTEFRKKNRSYSPK